MKRTRILCALVWVGFASVTHAQLVPLSQCGAAIPCSIPVGLRPADAAAVSPYARAGQGNTLISVEAAIEDGLKPKVITRAVAEDPSERAARLFVKRNPTLIMPTRTPTPGSRESRVKSQE
jgi:hypothetical protein